MMKLLVSTKSKITEDENSETVALVQVKRVVLVHFNLSTKIIHKTQESCMHLFFINPLVNYYIFLLKMLYF